jgi:predicted nucleic acid-binding protein
MVLIDTNVMMAASAVRELSNVATRAMPREVELREQVFAWLAAFDLSDSRLVFDDAGLIQDEYNRNLPHNWQEQEYGQQVLQSKLDRTQVEFVPIDTLEANGEHIAVLEPQHEVLVTDRDDRKWVACALSADVLHGVVPPIVYGAESDWYVAEAQLCAIGLCFVRLLPDDWYQAKLART